MVEKIIINPNKVRGYGNIINQHSTTDYTNYTCTLTEETDTVNGAETIIYEMEDTILFYDSGVTPTNNTDDWYYTEGRLTITPSSTGTTITNTYTGTSLLIANKPGTSQGGYDYTPPFQVEFDLLDYTSGSSCDIQVYDGTNNSYRSFRNMSIPTNTLTHIKVKVLSDKVEFYADNELKHTITATMGNSRTALRLGAPDDIIKFKNFIVRDL